MTEHRLSEEQVVKLRKAAASILSRVVAGEHLTVEMFEEIAQIHQFQIACQNVKHNDLRLQADGLKMPDMSTADYELSVKRRALERIPLMFS